MKTIRKASPMVAGRLGTPSPPPLHEVYGELYDHFGPQGWWPGRTRMEIILGAILTQNTAWSNVEKALLNLRRARALTLSALLKLSTTDLAELIRPAGYFNVKAARIRAFVDAVGADFGGSLHRMFVMETDPLRAWLLSIKGIGPETADSILLYAGQRPVFVVDAYTVRILARHNWLPRGGYDAVAALFGRALPEDVSIYNEYHALIVEIGKTFCRPRPRCAGCPLRHRLPG